jgi:hypothetical protein
LSAENYLFGVEEFDKASLQGGIYNRNMVCFSLYCFRTYKARFRLELKTILKTKSETWIIISTKSPEGRKKAKRNFQWLSRHYGYE